MDNKHFPGYENGRDTVWLSLGTIGFSCDKLVKNVNTTNNHPRAGLDNGARNQAAQLGFTEIASSVGAEYRTSWTHILT